MPVVNEERRKRARLGWGLALSITLPLLLIVGGAVAFVWFASEPVIVGDWALTGPRCWVEEPPPSFSGAGRVQGTMDFFNERGHTAGFRLYQREPRRSNP